MQGNVQFDWLNVSSKWGSSSASNLVYSYPALVNCANPLIFSERIIPQTYTAHQVPWKKAEVIFGTVFLKDGKLSSAFDASIYPNNISSLKVQQLNFYKFARRVCSATNQSTKNNRNHVLAILFSIPRHHSIFVIHGTAKGYHGSLWQARFVTKAVDHSSRCTKSAMNFSTLAVYLLFFKLFLVAEWSLKARLRRTVKIWIRNVEERWRSESGLEKFINYIYDLSDYFCYNLI